MRHTIARTKQYLQSMHMRVQRRWHLLWATLTVSAMATFVVAEPAQAAPAATPAIDNCTAVNILKPVFNLLNGTAINFVKQYGTPVFVLLILIGAVAAVVGRGKPWFQRAAILFIVVGALGTIVAEGTKNKGPCF